MKRQVERNSGIALIAGSVLMTATMVLHPAGGDLAQLIKIQRVLIVSHAIAILSIPLVFFGFLGLTRKLGTDIFFSTTALSIISFGLVAAMVAAATNGLALPLFVGNYQDASPDTLEAIAPVLRYNASLNRAFALLYVGALCLSVASWSIAILKTRKLPLWTGYFGMSLSTIALSIWASGVNFANFYGFRLFVFGSVFWILSIGIYLIRQNEERTQSLS